jgi:hypothetical protein
MLYAVLYACGNLLDCSKKITFKGRFEKKVLWIISELNGEELIGPCRKFYTEKLHNSYSLPDIVTTRKARRMR